MPASPGKWKKSLLHSAISALPVLLIIYSVKTEGDTWLLARGLSAVVSPVQAALASVIRTTRDAWRGYVWLVGAARQNDELRRRVDSLMIERAAVEELERENRRLKSMLEFKEANIGHKMKAARITAYTMSSQSDMIAIDAGTSSGIAKGMAVVSVEGLVGRVIRAHGNRSDVLLVTDRNSSIAGIDQVSRARGIVKGRGINRSGVCDFEYIPRSESILVGEPVVTAGMGEFFPAGIIIGKISRADRTVNELFQKAEIVPAVNFAKLDEVMVVTKPSIPEPVKDR